jgi:hypothetical protein
LFILFLIVKKLTGVSKNKAGFETIPSQLMFLILSAAFVPLPDSSHVMTYCPANFPYMVSY